MRMFPRLFVVGWMMLCGGAVWAQPIPKIPASEKEKPAVAKPAPVQEIRVLPELEMQYVVIPGPLRSFLRMAGISQKIGPEDVLPSMARRVYMYGYRAGQRTESLVLLEKYMKQAQELQNLVGAGGAIRVASCQDAAPLLLILGYRVREGCGKKPVVLETANADKAFLTVDSGFPLADLEEALDNGAPFVYPYAGSQVPVLFREKEWINLAAFERKSASDVLSVLFQSPSISHMYWALSRSSGETRMALQRAPGLQRLLPYASTMDFYGGQIMIRNGKIQVPGGAGADAAWKELVGANPLAPGDFVLHLMEKDNGWMAAYYDVMSRVSRDELDHLVQRQRLKRLYEAFRTSDNKFTATKSTFQKAPSLLVLFSRLQWEENGDPHVPGGLDAWKEILRDSREKDARDWAKHGHAADTPESLLETLVASSRRDEIDGPLQIYLMLSEIDRGRAMGEKLSAGTVRLMALNYSRFGSWYLIFSEFPQLSDTSIARFINVAGTVDGHSNQTFRANALGGFQAEVGFWQILARQGEIPAAELNASWEKALGPFENAANSTQLFDAIRSSVSGLMMVASGKAERSQDEMIDLLAGPTQTSLEGQRVHEEMAARIRSVLADQRLVSLDTIFALSDGLSEANPNGLSKDQMLQLAGELREFEMPQPIFTNNEKAQWAPKVFSNHHAELQIKTDLSRVIQGASTKLQKENARGQLVPFLRDAVVGLNYAYYEPPGAMILHNNPLFVRSHDFAGVSVIGSDRIWDAPVLYGGGITAGGGAFLSGSLNDLSYSLARTEADMIAPENIQALIWNDLVPNLITSSTMPRWWSLNANEMHAAALYQESGEEILAASVKNEKMRIEAVGILAERMSPDRLEQVERALERDGKKVTVDLPKMLPADLFYLGVEFRQRYPDEASVPGSASAQVDALARLNPQDVSYVRLSREFGVPHPTFAQTNERSLLHVKPMPFYGGYSARLFGESWESSNLYWARLADELGFSPVMMNRIVPEMTRQMASKIFASDLEDWPSLIRAMEEAGDDMKQGKVFVLPAKNGRLPAVASLGESGH